MAYVWPRRPLQRGMIAAMGRVSAGVRRFRASALFKSSAIYVFSSLLNAVIPFCLLPILTRYLSTEQYGEIAMFQVAMTIVAAIVGMGVGSAVGRKNYDHDAVAELKPFIGACLQVFMASAFAALAALIAYDRALTTILGVSQATLVAAWATATASFITQIRMTQWQTNNMASSYAIVQIAQGIVNAAATMTLVIGMSMGAPGRIWAQTGTAIAFAACSLISLARDGLIGLSWRPDLIREALKFGAPLVPHALGILLFAAIDRFVIANYLGLSEAGLYGVGAQIASAFWLVLSSANSAFAPWLFGILKRNERSELLAVTRLTYVYFVVVLAAAGLCFALSPFVLRLLAGERYIAAAPVFGWLCIAYAFAGMYLMVVNYIYFSKRTAFLGAVTLTTGALNAVLSLALVGPLGISGVAIAFLVATGVRFALTWVLAVERCSMPWFDRDVFRPLAQTLP